MPSLRQRLREPQTYLLALCLAGALLVVDANRRPADQWSAGVWIGGVGLYQKLARPLLEGRVRCRYVPSCSEYSIGAVEAVGIVRGLRLSAKRLLSCGRSVPLGTVDPVPEA